LDIAVQDDLLPGSEVTPSVEETEEGFRIHRRDFLVTYDSRRNALTGSVARSMYSFDSMLRVFFTQILTDLDGLLIHGSSVLEGGRAFLFYGVSGSGKTTTTRLSQPRTILSDELTLVRKIAGAYRAFGTPFWGELQINGENVSAPLECVLLLVKDASDFLEPQTSARALRTLLPCVLFFSHEDGRVNRVVDRAADLAESVSTAKLHFRKDAAFWSVLAQEFPPQAAERGE
jgi:hypothetical protein